MPWLSSPPMTSTRASSRSVAVDAVRAWVSDPVGLKVDGVGSQISAVSREVGK